MNELYMVILLITQRAKGPRVKRSEAEQIVVALKEKNIGSNKSEPRGIS